MAFHQSHFPGVKGCGGKDWKRGWEPLGIGEMDLCFDWRGLILHPNEATEQWEKQGEKVVKRIVYKFRNNKK